MISCSPNGPLRTLGLLSEKNKQFENRLRFKELTYISLLSVSVLKIELFPAVSSDFMTW